MKLGALLLILRIPREYSQKMYANNLDNLDNMSKFLEIHTTKTDSRRKRKYEQMFNN